MLSHNPMGIKGVDIHYSMLMQQVLLKILCSDFQTSSTFLSRKGMFLVLLNNPKSKQRIYIIDHLQWTFTAHLMNEYNTPIRFWRLGAQMS